MPAYVNYFYNILYTQVSTWYRVRTIEYQFSMLLKLLFTLLNIIVDKYFHLRDRLSIMNLILNDKCMICPLFIDVPSF